MKGANRPRYRPGPDRIRPGVEDIITNYAIQGGRAGRNNLPAPGKEEGKESEQKTPEGANFFLLEKISTAGCAAFPIPESLRFAGITKHTPDGSVQFAKVERFPD